MDLEDFCRLNGSNYEDFCYGGGTGSEGGSGGNGRSGSQGGSDPGDSGDDNSEEDDRDEQTECAESGGTWDDGGWCDMPVDDELRGTCICYWPDHTQHESGDTTYPQCMAMQALETEIWDFPVSCSWH